MINEQIIKSYLDFIKNERGLSENTIITYKTYLYMFYKIYDKKLDNCTQQEIRDILNNISNNRGVGSRNHMLIVLNQLFIYMENIMHIIKYNPCDGIMKTKVVQKERKSLSLNQVNKILEVIPKDNIRDNTLIRFMVQTGLRISEVCNLKINDVDLEEGFVYVLGKGNKERSVPIVKSLEPYLISYLEWRISRDNTSDYFFISYLDKKMYKSKGITRTNVLVSLKKYAEKAGISSDLVSPHVMRHTYATLLVNKGIDIYVLSNTMGHTSITTTQIYAKINKFRNKQIMENINVLE